MCFCLQIISRKTNCRHLWIRCPSSLSLFPGGIQSFTFSSVQRAGSGCGCGADVSEGVLRTWDRWQQNTLGDDQEVCDSHCYVCPFLKYTATASFYGLSRAARSCLQRTVLLMPVWEDFTFLGGGKVQYLPMPTGAGGDGEVKILSGKSALFLLGHTTHNSFPQYNFCMYLVILSSVGEISCNLHRSFRQTEFILNFGLR